MAHYDVALEDRFAVDDTERRLDLSARSRDGSRNRAGKVDRAEPIALRDLARARDE
jgi:hypothetical protein